MEASKGLSPEWVVTSSGVFSKETVAKVGWLPTIRDGRCFWDALSKVIGEGGPDAVKARALDLGDVNLQSLVAQYGGSASTWRERVQSHLRRRYAYADHYAIAPAAANLSVMIVIWSVEECRVWTYKPARYERVVLLKLEAEHFELADPQTYTQDLFEALVSGCHESWEKSCPLLCGGGKRWRPKLSKAD
eukprot:4792109-Amphidinium_carterae.1